MNQNNIVFHVKMYKTQENIYNWLILYNTGRDLILSLIISY